MRPAQQEHILQRYDRQVGRYDDESARTSWFNWLNAEAACMMTKRRLTHVLLALVHLLFTRCLAQSTHILQQKNASEGGLDGGGGIYYGTVPYVPF